MTERLSPTDSPSPEERVPFYGERFQKDAASMYAEMRRLHGPVVPVLLDGDLPAWLVLGYREVHQVTEDSELFARDTRRWNEWDRVPGDWPLMPYVVHNPSVMFTEDDEHRRRAGAIGDALSDVDQFDLQRSCEQIADRLVDTFAGSGQAELISEFAQRIPIAAVAGMFGMPESETPGLVRDVALSLDVGPEAMPAYGRVQESMARLVERKRREPGADVPSVLLDHPAGLSDDEISMDLLVVTAAAQQPTTNWIGNTLRLMLTDSRFEMTLTGGRASVAQAMNEVLWHDTPTQNFIGRFAARDTVLGGRRIRSGDMLVLGLAAANADPNGVLGPDVDLQGNRAHMSFGHGEHGCPYPAPEVAEVIARSTVEVLLDRLPDVELEVPPASLAWRPSVWMRGLEDLPVRFTPAQVVGA